MLPWFLGVYLCEIHSKDGRIFPSSLRLFAAAFMVAVFSAEFAPTSFLRNEIFAVIFAWSIELYCSRKVLSPLEQWMARFGVISYSFYLLHGPLIDFLLHGPIRKLFRPGYPYNQMTVGGFLFIFVPIAALSWVSYKLVEAPFHTWGIRLSSVPSPTAAPAKELSRVALPS